MVLLLGTYDWVEFIIDDDGRLCYLTQDDPVQFAQVDVVIEQLSAEQPGVISHIVLCELVWILSRAYKYSREQVAGVIHTVLSGIPD